MRFLEICWIVAIVTAAPNPVIKQLVRKPNPAPNIDGSVTINHEIPGAKPSKLTVDCKIPTAVKLVYENINTGNAKIKLGECEEDVPIPTNPTAEIQSNDSCKPQVQSDGGNTGITTLTWNVRITEDFAENPEEEILEISDIIVKCKVNISEISPDNINQTPYKPDDSANIGTANALQQIGIDFQLENKNMDGNKWVMSFKPRAEDLPFIGARKFTIKSCMATPDKELSPQKDIITDGCIEDIFSVVSRKENEFTLTVTTFVFKNHKEKEVVFRCEARLCDADDATCGGDIPYCTKKSSP